MFKILEMIPAYGARDEIVGVTHAQAIPYAYETPALAMKICEKLAVYDQENGGDGDFKVVDETGKLVIVPVVYDLADIPF